MILSGKVAVELGRVQNDRRERAGLDVAAGARGAHSVGRPHLHRLVSFWRVLGL